MFSARPRLYIESPIAYMYILIPQVQRDILSLVIALFGVHGTRIRFVLRHRRKTCSSSGLVDLCLVRTRVTLGNLD